VEEAPFKYLIKVLIIKIKRIFRIRIAKKKPKKKLNDRVLDYWVNLRELKKLKLRLKDKIGQLKH
jgi:hypothetical protein|tara:strand:+ start:270 stop:464 length:195 start_codon:yes stop_codon:yes gene_type:complete